MTFDVYAELRRQKEHGMDSDPDMLQQLKDQYPKGTRVVLIEMDDPFAPPAGTQGTVIGIDPLGTIHVSWDSGSTLGVVYECDRIMKVE